MTGLEAFLCLAIVVLSIWFCRERARCYNKGYNDSAFDIKRTLEKAMEGYYIVSKTDVDGVYKTHELEIIVKE